MPLPEMHGPWYKYGTKDIAEEFDSAAEQLLKRARELNTELVGSPDRQ